MKLTDEEIIKAWDAHTVPVFDKNGINPIVFARAIEAAVNAKQGEQEAVAWVADLPYPAGPADSFSWVETALHKVPLYTHPAPVNAQEVRLWDSQWVNVVNHDNAYRDWSKEDAINHAVKMTEKLIAENVNGNKLPPAPVNQQLLDNLTEQRGLYMDIAVKQTERIKEMEQALDVALEALEKSMYPQKLQLDAIAKIKELK